MNSSFLAKTVRNHVSQANGLPQKIMMYGPFE